MPKRVEIISKAEVFKKFIFRIEEAHLRHERYNGTMSDEIIRLNFNRGDSVAAIVHDTQANTVLLTEQFRYPTHEKGPGWLVELPAGVVDPKDTDPSQAMRRELEEEVGFRVNTLRHISTFYLSPGGSSERIHLYYAQVTLNQQVSTGGGLLAEGEDIRRLTVSLAEAVQMVEKGTIADAKTLIGLQWLQLSQMKK